MAIKAKNIFSMLISLIIYYIFNIHEKNEFILKNDRKILVLDHNNIDRLRTGNWVICTDISSVNFDMNESLKEHSIALLLVNNYNNAKIAAMLSLKNPNKTLIIEDDRIINDTSLSFMNKDISFKDVLDYMVFYQILCLKKHIESHRYLESAFCSLFEQVIDFINKISIF